MDGARAGADEDVAEAGIGDGDGVELAGGGPGGGPGTGAGFGVASMASKAAVVRIGSRKVPAVKVPFFIDVMCALQVACRAVVEQTGSLLHSPSCAHARMAIDGVLSLRMACGCAFAPISTSAFRCDGNV